MAGPGYGSRNKRPAAAAAQSAHARAANQPLAQPITVVAAPCVRTSRRDRARPDAHALHQTISRTRADAINTAGVGQRVSVFPPVPQHLSRLVVSAPLQTQLTVSPSSTTGSVPVMYLASSDARNGAA